MNKTKTKLKTKIISTRVASLLLILFLMTANSNIVLANELYYDNPQITPAKMLSLTNQSREENGLVALTVNQKLASAAEAKTDNMFECQYFNHNSPSGATPWDWIKAAGYDYRYAGENLAIDFVTAESAHKALMTSDSHRENILNQNYTEVGISVKRDIFEGSESVIIVMEFGTPLQTKAAYAGDDNIKPDGSINNMGKESHAFSSQSSAERLRQGENLQPSGTSLNLKEDNNQGIGEAVEKQENKEAVYSNDEGNKNRYRDRGSEDGGETARNTKMIKFAGMSAGGIKKVSLEKVYAENIYWESYSKREGNGQATIMSSRGQNTSGFDPSVFYVYVLSILLVFELPYLFLNFMMGGKSEVKNV